MKPDYVIHHGDCRDVLATLPEKSCHAVICSPPYWGLRKYEGIESSVWGELDNGSDLTRLGYRKDGEHHWQNDGRCGYCPAWRGLLGLEPTIDMYVEHIVECFLAVKRVLRDDGTLWLNLGDSYSSSMKGSGGPSEKQLSNAGSRFAPLGLQQDVPSKNLIGQPWRVAFALQADGWYLRSALPWIKRSAMPEAITGSAWIPHKVHVKGEDGETEYVECPGCDKCTPNDGLVLRWGAGRPTSALEYMFLFTKSAECFWDMEAVRVKAATATIARDKYSRILANDGPQSVRHDHETQVDPGGRAFRNTDLFFESLKPPYGMIFAGNEPVGLDVTPAGIKEKHYASFPRKLIRPLILASTSAKGCCPECGTPWVRVTTQIEGDDTTWKQSSGATSKHAGRIAQGLSSQQSGLNKGTKSNYYANAPQHKTLGWKPGCECIVFKYTSTYRGVGTTEQPAPIPCTVLDPFVGSGTAGIVATQQGRRFIGIDASAEYCKMARRRIANPEPESEVPDVAGQMMFDELEPEVEVAVAPRDDVSEATASKDVRHS